MKNCIPRKGEKTKGSWCEICQMNNHNTKDCFRLKRMREERNKEQTGANKRPKTSVEKGQFQEGLCAPVSFLQGTTQHDDGEGSQAPP